MTNSITTVVEVTKNIHDKVIMASWQPSCHDKDTDRLWCCGLCQDVINKDISNNVLFAFKMLLLSERHLIRVVINMHKHYFIFTTYVMSWLWRCHASLM